MSTTEFDEIRPYHDDEVPQILEELIADQAFRKVVEGLFTDTPFELVVLKMRACKTKKDFQLAFGYPFIKNLIQKFSDGLTSDFSLIPDRKAAYTYVSNHRDIVLDAGILSIVLVDEGMDSVEIAIGDNLLVYPWISKLVRLNKSFIVQRGLSVKQIMESSARMSRYIHYTIQEKNQSIWIAQREGRSKDSDDRTQDSVLKMLAMGGQGDVVDKLLDLNIAPLAISYEYDPCDYLKAEEFQLKRDVEGYKKTMQDDLKNMEVGLLGYKGRVHFQSAGCINEKIKLIDRTLPKADVYRQIALRIDAEIHRNYKIFPNNYIAYDLLERTNRYVAKYSPEQLSAFKAYLQGQLEKIEIPNKDVAFLYDKLLLMYANPLKNYLAAHNVSE